VRKEKNFDSTKEQVTIFRSLLNFLQTKPTSFCLPYQILLLLSGLSLLYYLLVLLQGGASALFIWLFFSVFFLIWAKFLAARRTGGFHFPHWFLRLFYSLFSLLLLLFVLVEGMILSGFFAKAPSSLDYLIVLGAKVNDTTPSLALQNRIDTAYDYLVENPDTICIASGGQGSGESVSEADCIRQILIEKGISEERILTEDRSVRTAQNLRYSAQLIDDSNVSIGIVSNNFHIFRGKALAKGCGFQNVYGLPADFPIWLLPHYMAREFLSIVVDSFLGNITWFGN
jgi:uncharacterized SAM-binding protein YcdF (DUF218 family)